MSIIKQYHLKQVEYFLILFYFIRHFFFFIKQRSTKSHIICPRLFFLNFWLTGSRKYLEMRETKKLQKGKWKCRVRGYTMIIDSSILRACAQICRNEFLSFKFNLNICNLYSYEIIKLLSQSMTLSCWLFFFFYHNNPKNWFAYVKL